VVVVLTSDHLGSTALGPIEVFSTAGVLWQVLHGLPEAPGFNVKVA
jgi:hypothetical protein